MPPNVICCGLTCLDVELHACAHPATPESITTFSHANFAPGGSAPQTACALAPLQVPATVLGPVGNDTHSTMLRDVLKTHGVHHTHLITLNHQSTSVSILPLFSDGTRGCYVTLAANLVARPHHFLPALADASHTLRLFHFGYPHLMPHLQAASLRTLLDRVRHAAPRAMLTLDLNGASIPEARHAVLHSALALVAAVHANLEEACVITGAEPVAASATLPVSRIASLAGWFTSRGAAIVCITCGRDGVVLATDDAPRDDVWSSRVRLSRALERGARLYRGAFAVADGVAVNASGAGDAFTAGVIAELVESAGERGVVRVADAGLVSALRRIDGTLLGDSHCEIGELINKVRRERQRIPARDTMDAGTFSNFPDK